MYIKRKSDGATIALAHHLPVNNGRITEFDSWLTEQEVYTSCTPRLSPTGYYRFSLIGSPVDVTERTYGLIETSTFPSNVTLPLVTHVNHATIKDNHIRKIKSCFDRLDEATLENNPMVESYEMRGGGYYRNLVNLFPPQEFYHFTSFKHHEITVSEQTELISAFSQIVLDKFIPEDGQGFIELNLGHADQRFTTAIDYKIQQDHSTSNGTQPSRAWEKFFNSPLAIDEFSHFSFVDDQKFSLITDDSRVIKAMEISNFYRGAETTWEIVDVPISKLHKGNYIFPLVSEVKVLDIETLTHVTKKIVVFAVQREWPRVIRYNRSRNFIADLIQSFTYADGLKFFDPEKYEAKMKELYGEHVKYCHRVTQVWKGDFNPGLRPNEIFCENSLTAEHFAPMFSASSLSSNSEYNSYKEILETRKEISQKQEKAQRDLQNSKYILNDTLSDIEDKKRRIERLQNIIEEHTSKLEVYRLDVDKHEKTSNGFKEALKSIAAAADDAEVKMYDIEENLTPDIEASTKWINNIAKTGIRVVDILYQDTSGDLISIKNQPSIGLKATQPSSGYALHEVIFETNKPLVINVDKGQRGDNCKKVVGGPYSVRLTASELFINLATSTACFGWNEGEYVWIHPHTGSFWISTTGSWETFASQLVSHTGRACLGEASPIIYNAFRNNDPKSAMMGALIWITSANSSDTWGKNYKYFPKVSEVNFPTISIEEDQVVVAASEPAEQPEVLITDQEIDTAVEALADVIQGWNDDEEEAQPEDTTQGVEGFVTMMQHLAGEWVEEERAQQETEETDEEPEVDTQNLRPAGRPGYRPLGRRYARTTPVTE